MTNNTSILLRHNYVDIPVGDREAGQEGIATILMNLSHYGYALNMQAYKSLVKLSPGQMADWWVPLEKELKSLTGADRKIGDFVVYKNFPAEVLSKSDAEYWIPQILMYWGFSKEFFTEEVKPRAKMDEQPRANVLKLASKNTLQDVLNSYLKSPARWKDQELQDVLFLSNTLPINMSKLAFKENLINLASHLMNLGRPIHIKSATDVLRLAAGLSDQDVSLRTVPKFQSFKKPMRRYLLNTLELCSNLEEDVARRPEMFKRLFHNLHPFDYKNRFPKVCRVNDDLYKDRLETFNTKVEQCLTDGNVNALHYLSDKPGDFRRRLVHTLDLFGNKAVKAFTDEKVLSKLTTAQVVSLRKYLDTVNDRKHRVFPPKGNWAKVQVAEARHVDEKMALKISNALGKVLKKRVPAISEKNLGCNTDRIKLPSNDGEVSPYNRGTSFHIPPEVKFIRTASYWKIKSDRNIWFDNGWNFFDADWKSLGACCWNAVKFGNNSAVFSGDPTNSQEMKGRAAQLIDLYPDKLVADGVRYAVWNILCFSQIPFKDAEEVFAALQWGKDPQKGKLFEPSRCQLQFPLQGESMTKYICLLDLQTREMIYLDANLKGHVGSASNNGDILAEKMPAFMEYINSLPSVFDLFVESVVKKADNDLHVLYSDKDVELKDVSAYVFKPENKDNKYKSVDLNSFLT